MAEIKLRKKDAQTIIASLEAGVVPVKGVQHVLVGRSNEVKEIIDTLQKLEDGNSDLRFWVASRLPHVYQPHRGGWAGGSGQPVPDRR